MQFDNISCAAMSVTSNSTSQLQGNELYPIDCSIQFDGLGNAATTTMTKQQQQPANDTLTPIDRV